MLEGAFRLAELTGNVASTTFNAVSDLADFLAEATAPRAQEDNTAEEDDETDDEEIPSASTDMPFRRDRSRSRDDEESVGHRLLRRGVSRSRSSTPDRGYPKKKK